MEEQLRHIEKQIGEVTELYKGTQDVFTKELKKADIPENVKNEINKIMSELNHAISNMDINSAEKAQAKFEVLKKKYL